ncbi:MAG TPA: ParB/RepB/Spo0J family partition protein [Candidatus Saccharimonadales bacterium]
MTKKKGLGRSFESLIPTDLLDESFDPTAGDDHKVSELRNIRLSEITADIEQPRKRFDEAHLLELTESIRIHGVLQPIVVVPKAGKYEIVAGERRFRASTAAGLETIPALVRTLSDQHKLELALIENLQRHDLNAIETATAYGKLRDQFNLSLEEIGKTVGGKSVSAVSNTLRLLKLSKPVREAIMKGDITEGQARPLIDLDSVVIDELLPKIIKEQWSARMIEQVVKSYRAPVRVAKSNTRANEYEAVAARFTKRLGVNTQIKAGQGGRGKIVIAFKDEKDLERIQRLLGE